MNVLVVGYGSIGKRHVEVLTQLGYEVSVVSRYTQNIGFYATVGEAMQVLDFEYIVVANETSRHHQTLIELMEKNYYGKILVEKPLFAKSEPREAVKNCYVAYNLRFHPVISQLVKLLEDEEIISVNSYVGQYLPTWRPQTDYSQGYSAKSNLGGGVIRDLSHELDYLLYLFGDWTAVVASKDKVSNLQIDSEDLCNVVFKTTKNIKVALEMNYLDRIIQRYVTIQTNNKTIKADFIKNELNINGELIKLPAIDRNYTYLKQHLSILNGESYACSYKDGLNIVQFIEAIETSSDKKVWVYHD